MNPFARIERSPCMQRLPQSRQSRKGEQLALFSRVSQLWELFSRVGDCENRAGINCHTKDRWCDPTVRFWKRMPCANFFSRVDRCENQFAWQELRLTHCHLNGVLCCLTLVPQNLPPSSMKVRDTCDCRKDANRNALVKPTVGKVE
jgi:hypothetical protein